MPAILIRLMTGAAVLFCLLCPVLRAEDKVLSPCVRCHEETYMKAISSHYRHAVAEDKCDLCHIIQNAGDAGKGTRFSVFDRENILYLEHLKNDVPYQIMVIASAPPKLKGEPFLFDMRPGDAEEEISKFPPVSRISDVVVEEVKKGLTVRAAVSWATDSYATSELEYYSRDNSSGKITEDNLLSKKHRVELKGLKHSEEYRFRVTSRDIRGNTVRSEELTLDTSKEILSPSGTATDNAPPRIEEGQLVRIKDRKGVYLKLSLSRPSELAISATEISGNDSKHGNGLVTERFLKITVCYKCHPPAVSHPVDVKAHGSQLRTPDDLPTIEDGVLTCVTCHFPHGGDAPYFARLDFKKDICIKCHIESYK